MTLKEANEQLGDSSVIILEPSKGQYQVFGIMYEGFPNASLDEVLEEAKEYIVRGGY